MGVHGEGQDEEEGRKGRMNGEREGEEKHVHCK